LEVGLVLHFGRRATAHRVFFENIQEAPAKGS
jgi:hypothetical protein